MRILSILNPTNVDRLECDSGYIFHCLVVPHVLSGGHTFHFASPATIEGVENSQFHHMPFMLGRHKYESRFNFPWREWSRLLDDCAPDVIWLHQPELAPALRAVLSVLGSRAIIASYLHYFPYGLKDGVLLPDPSLAFNSGDVSIQLAFLSGVLASDLLMIHGRYAGELLAAGLSTFNLSLPRITKVAVVPPPIDPRLQASELQTFSARDIVIYNHRLYRHYGTDRLVDFLTDRWSAQGHSFVVMDVLGRRSTERTRLDPSVDEYRRSLSRIPGVRIDSNGNNRAHYANVLSTCKYGVAPFRQSCPWSMSVVDCLAVGVPVVAENFAFFPEVVPAACLVDGSLEEFGAVCNRLATDEEFWSRCSREGREAIAHLSPSAIANQMCAHSQDVLRSRSHCLPVCQ